MPIQWNDNRTRWKRYPFTATHHQRTEIANYNTARGEKRNMVKLHEIQICSIFLACNWWFEQYKYASVSSSIILREKKAKNSANNLNHRRKQYINGEQKHRFTSFCAQLGGCKTRNSIVDLPQKHWSIGTNFIRIPRFSARDPFGCIIQCSTAMKFKGWARSRSTLTREKPKRNEK